MRVAIYTRISTDEAHQPDLERARVGPCSSPTSVALRRVVQGGIAE